MEKLPESEEKTRNRRYRLGTASAIHFLHDGFSDLLYLLVPVWQVELALSLSQVGAIKSCFSGMLAAAQVPFGFISERVDFRWSYQVSPEKRRSRAPGTADPSHSVPTACTRRKACYLRAARRAGA